MKKNYYRKISKNSGFSLVELIVAIVIILVLSSVLVPAVTKYISKAKDAALVSEAREILNASYSGITDALKLHPASFKASANRKTYTALGQTYGFVSSYLLASDQGNADSSRTNVKSAIAHNMLTYLIHDKKNTSTFKFYNQIITGRFDIANIPKGEVGIVLLYSQDGHVLLLQYAKDGYLVTYENGVYTVAKGGTFVNF